jgi:hypothetical protein
VLTAAINVVSGKDSAATFEGAVLVLAVFSGPAFITSAFASREIAGPFVDAAFVAATFAEVAFAEVVFVMAGLANGTLGCATDSGLTIGTGVGTPLAACMLCGAYTAATAKEYRVVNDAVSGSELDGETLDGETEGVGVWTADACPFGV